MEKTQIIQWLLASGIVAGLVSFLTTRYMVYHNKRVEFQYDYRKYILEKRKASYDKLENTLFLLNKNGDLTGFLIGLINQNADEIELHGNNLLIAIDTVHKDDIWYISALRNTLHEFHSLVGELKRRSRSIEKREMQQKNQMDEKADRSLDENIEWLEKYISEKERDNNFHKYASLFMKADMQLWNLYFNDLMELDSVDKFKKEKLKEMNTRAEKTGEDIAKNKDRSLREERQLLDKLRKLRDDNKLDS